MSRINISAVIRALFRAVALAVLAFVLAPATAWAFDTAVYAPSSRLAQGRWVAVGVPTSGLYVITADQLRRMGLGADPSRVRVYGYGGRRPALQLRPDTYIDDLPPVQAALTPQGLVFWGEGPEQWTTIAGSTPRRVMDMGVYATEGRYFLTLAEGDSAAAPAIPAGGLELTADGPAPATTYMCAIHHEQELAAAGENGWLLVGEDFRYTPRRSLTFQLDDRVEGSEVWMQTSFVTNTPSGPSRVAYSVNGAALPVATGDEIPSTSSNDVAGREGVARRTFLPEDPAATKLTIDISHSAGGSVRLANLNYLCLNYQRHLRLPAAGVLDFQAAQTAVALQCGADRAEGLTVWDVTDPSSIRAMALTVTDPSTGTVAWRNDYTGTRRYVAFAAKGGPKIPAPATVGAVATQDLHAMDVPQMVIVTPAQWVGDARRLAQMHRANAADPLDVAVVLDQEVYNEFSSGTQSPFALRHFFKMLYDRGGGKDGRLRYAILMAPATFDNRHLLTETQTLGCPTLPAYYPGNAAAQLAEATGFGTDDLVAMLEDGQGTDLGLDRLSIAVGRLPVYGATDAAATVDKIGRYMADASTRNPAWRNTMLLLADDGDGSIHLSQTEEVVQAVAYNRDSPYVFNKVYLDAFQRQNGQYPLAREQMFRVLDEGTAWWTFIGHANTTSWTADGQFTFTDINNVYLTHVPMLYAATCNFLRWDSNTMSGAEIMFHQPYGGLIGAISATRPVYISENAHISRAVGLHISRRDSLGRLLTIGEVYQQAKNAIYSPVSDRDPSTGQVSTRWVRRSNTNRLRYVLMGDPALRTATPSGIVTLDSVAGRPVGAPGDDQDPDQEPPTLAAMQRAVLSGSVTSAADGAVMTDFNGTVTLTLYDAEHSTTTTGLMTDGDRTTFEEMGDRLLAATAPVVAGRWSVTVALPAEIADNYRPATLSMFATRDGGAPGDGAAGVNRQLYVYGRDYQAPADTVPPVVDMLALNHPSFRPGGTVDAAPMVLATVSDDVAINLSTAGIGHAMTVTIDDGPRAQTLSDVSRYYTPAADGSPGGSIAYPLSGLSPGLHTLRLRVWDTSANSGTAAVDFFVSPDAAPHIYEVYTDASPATDTAGFYVTHDRPDQTATVTVSVYDLMGRMVWTGSRSGRSDMFTTIPVTWDLLDQGGRRVPRGIYVYRATVTTDGVTHTTASRRMAVAAAR